MSVVKVVFLLASR